MGISGGGLYPGAAGPLRQPGGLPLEAADSMIDNVIGTYALPIGVVRGMVVNGKEYLVPMVCEEPWVVSCAEKGPNWPPSAGVPCNLYRLHHDLPDTDYPGHQPTCCLP